MYFESEYNPEMRCFDGFEFFWSVQEVIEFLGKKRLDDDEYRMDLTDEVLRKLEVAEKDGPVLMTVT